ncbi:unnamed protein product [Ectocarpus sp. 8 AP-2014]
MFAEADGWLIPGRCTSCATWPSMIFLFFTGFLFVVNWWRWLARRQRERVSWFWGTFFFILESPHGEFPCFAPRRRQHYRSFRRRVIVVAFGLTAYWMLLRLVLSLYGLVFLCLTFLGKETTLSVVCYLLLLLRVFRHFFYM